MGNAVIEGLIRPEESSMYVFVSIVSNGRGMVSHSGVTVFRAITRGPWISRCSDPVRDMLLPYANGWSTSPVLERPLIWRMATALAQL